MSSPPRDYGNAARNATVSPAAAPHVSSPSHPLTDSNPGAAAGHDAAVAYDSSDLARPQNDYDPGNHGLGSGNAVHQDEATKPPPVARDSGTPHPTPVPPPGAPTVMQKEAPSNSEVTRSLGHDLTPAPGPAPAPASGTGIPRQSGPSLLTQALATARGIPSKPTTSTSTLHSEHQPSSQQHTTPPRPSPPLDAASKALGSKPTTIAPHDDSLPQSYDDTVTSKSAPQVNPMATPASASAVTVVMPNSLTTTTTTTTTTALPTPALDMSGLDSARSILLDHNAFLKGTRARGSSLERIEKEARAMDAAQRIDMVRPDPSGNDGSATPPATPLDKRLEQEDVISDLRSTHGSRKPEQRFQVGPEKIWSISSGEAGDGDEDGQVEKAVTEAIKGAESNGRSRKASHSLRFFREGLPKDDRDKGRRKEGRHGSHRDKPSPAREVPPPLPLSSDIAVEDFAKAVTTLPTPLSDASHEQGSNKLSRTKSLPIGSPETSVLGESPVLDDSREDYFGLRKTHGQIFDTSVEARSAHQEEHNGSETPEPHQDGGDTDRGERDDRRGSGDSTERGDSQEEGDESSEEKISSAVFMPHQGPEDSCDTDEAVTRQRPHANNRVPSRTEDFHPWLVKADEPEQDEDTARPKTEDEAPLRRTTDNMQAVIREVKLEKLPEHAVDEELDTNGLKKHEHEHEIDERHLHEDESEADEEPLEAIELIPYKHQVGGHTTLWRFSRRAVCKQLNNRENEFYEKVERHHRDLLTFLPRYIGVLNVTFHKQPRRRSIPKHSELQAPESSHAEGATDIVEPPDPNATRPVKEAVLNGPVNGGSEHRRIISQSLAASQVQIPTVTFDANRHILPRNLLQPTPPPAFYRTSSADAAAISDFSGQPKFCPPARPNLDDKHANSWGATMVNKRLRNEVFNDAFLKQPIPIHRHRRPHQKAIPLRMQQGLRPATSDGMLGRLIGDQTSHEDMSADRAQPFRSPLSPSHSDAGPSTEPARNDEKADLGPDDVEDVTGTSAPEPTTLADKVIVDKRKRRYSGSALRRKPRTVTESRGHLQYWEQADDAADQEAGEAELKQEAQQQQQPRKGSVIELSLTNGMGVEHEVSMEVSASTDINTADKLDSVSAVNTASTTAASSMSTSPVQEFRKVPRPVNPKEAQTKAQRDTRAEFFLLLEDLTAGMKRPCIMDLKMGTRQYGVEATPKKQKSQQGKCARTTSRELGVRVCGLQVWDVRTQSYVFKDKYFGRDLRAGREFQDALTRFLYDGLDTSSILRHIPTVLAKLDRLESIVRGLDGYRFYAASLLMFYDGDQSPEAAEYDTGVEESTDFATDTEEASALLRNNNKKAGKKKKNKRDIDFKIADFANSLTQGDLAEGKPCPPQHPNQPDWGFIRGLRTLRTYFLRIQWEIRSDMGLVGARGQNGFADVDLEPIDEGFISE